MNTKIVLLFIFQLILVSAYELDVDYGVDPSQSPLYSNEYFECDKGTRPKKLHKSQINDDYCDCLDGTDEPGTSACNEMKFYCKNEGHLGSFIFSSKVNDGICDCCDGSDEYNSNAHCTNTCQEEHEQWLVENSALLERERKGQELLEKWSLEGIQKYTTSLRDYKQTKDQLNALKVAYEELNKTYTKQLEEYHQNHSSLDIHQPELSELYDKSGLKGLNEEELRYVIVYMMNEMKQNTRNTTIYEVLYEAIVEVHKYNQIENDQDILSLQDFNSFSKDPQADPEIAQTKRRLDQLNSDLTAKQSTLETLKKYLEQEHGYYFELDHYIDQCYSQQVGKYTYKICPFKNAYQDSTSCTSLGRTFNLIRYDHSKSKSSISPSSKQQNPLLFNRMVFSKGDRCWNGPERSLTVDLVCDYEVSLQSITEPSTCVYQGVFHTPTACEPTEDMMNLAENVRKEPLIL